MIITSPKEFKDIIKALAKARKVFLIGCSECAALCGTGDEKALEVMKERLEGHGIVVTGGMIAKTGCQVLGTKTELKEHKDAVDDADVILSMSCGAGAQTIEELFPQKEVYTANDSLFLGNMSRFRQFDERCSMCGNCVLNETGGICPVTRCPKGILNGPCGGVRDGKCEVDPNLDCCFVLIYERLKKIDQIESFKNIKEPRDFQHSRKPSKLKVDTRVKSVGIYPASKASVEGEAPSGFAGGGGDASPFK